MSAYIGYYRPVPAFLEENQARARSEGASPDPRMQQRVRELPDKLPAGCTILGAYSPMAGAVFSDAPPPGVIVIETSNTADLMLINQHYAGFLVFQWVPATVIGTTRAEREAATAGPVAAGGARR